jgi:hypothetical protein
MLLFWGGGGYFTESFGVKIAVSDILFWSEYKVVK